MVFETVKLQLPKASVLVKPSELLSDKTSMVLPTFAVPVKVGVLVLV